MMILHTLTPVRVGVLLPVTGDIEVREPLEWARENINREGGIGGRSLELVYKDTSTGNTMALARELLADDSVQVVIGPPTSDDVYMLVPEFAAKKKVLISPYATAADIFRAFGKNGYFWRTPQGDVAQVKVLVSLVAEGNVTRAVLFTENTSYGKTFYDWTGFFTTESGIQLTDIRQFEPGSSSLASEVNRALEQGPEAIIAACGPADAAVIKREIDRHGGNTPLFLADSAVSPVLLSSLGSAAEGIEGTSPTADPTSGFAVAYREKFGHAPADYAAPVYDAVLLAAYTATRQDTAFLESPADSVRHVVYGSGEAAGWDAQGIREVISAIRRGGSPDIHGASGPLDYDREYGVDPLVTYYSRWVVEDGDFRTVPVTSAEKAGSAGVKGVSAARSRASPALMALPAAKPGNITPPGERTGFMAVIIGPSRGWSNYRHQSDALAVYTMLREYGVPDDHIILMLYDDIPYLAENPRKGDVHNSPGGPNLRTPADADYTGSQVTAETVKQVLLGNRTDKAPVVLESDRNTDVFVYVASHGSPGGIVFSNGTLPLFAREFEELAVAMNRTGRYREVVFMVDTCFGESMARNVTEPGLLFFTGAGLAEPSLGAVYDPEIRQWLSDEFTSVVLRSLRSNPDITFRELYIDAYEKVTGSHVQLVNADRFADINMPVREYLRP